MVEGEDHRLVLRDIFIVLDNNLDPGKKMVVRDKEQSADKYLNRGVTTQADGIEMLAVDHSFSSYCIDGLGWRVRSSKKT